MAGLQYTTIRAQCSLEPDTSTIETKRMTSPPWYLIHKRYALAAIRERLKNDELAMSDGTITAIILLAVYEVSFRLLEYGNVSDRHGLCQ